MSAALALAAESPSGLTEAWEVSPGIAGFWAFFGLAAAVVVLGVLVMRQMRRVDQNARLRMAREAAADKAAAPGHGAAGGTTEGTQAAGGAAVTDDPADVVVGEEGEECGPSAGTGQGQIG